MNKLLVVLGIYLVPITVLAAAPQFTWLECMKFASKMNAAMPMMVDQITEAKNTACTDENGKIVVVYVYQVQAKKSDIHKEDMESIRTDFIAEMCNDPDKRKFLNSLSAVERRYSDSSSVFIGAFRVKPQDCR